MLKGFIITNKFESRFKCGNLIFKNGFVELYDVTFTNVLGANKDLMMEYKQMRYNLDNVIELKM